MSTVEPTPNEWLNVIECGTPLFEAFRIADDVLRQAVQDISDLITILGEVNVDFADVRTIMTGMGMALMGTGIAKGEHRALEAAQRAISSPLLEETSIQGARGVRCLYPKGRVELKPTCEQLGRPGLRLTALCTSCIMFLLHSSDEATFS